MKFYLVSQTFFFKSGLGTEFSFETFMGLMEETTAPEPNG